MNIMNTENKATVDILGTVIGVCSQSFIPVKLITIVMSYLTPFKMSRIIKLIREEEALIDPYDIIFDNNSTHKNRELYCMELLDNEHKFESEFPAKDYENIRDQYITINLFIDQEFDKCDHKNLQPKSFFLIDNRLCVVFERPQWCEKCEEYDYLYYIGFCYSFSIFRSLAGKVVCVFEEFEGPGKSEEEFAGIVKWNDFIEEILPHERARISNCFQ